MPFLTQTLLTTSALCPHKCHSSHRHSSQHPHYALTNAIPHTDTPHNIRIMHSQMPFLTQTLLTTSALCPHKYHSSHRHSSQHPHYALTNSTTIITNTTTTI